MVNEIDGMDGMGKQGGRRGGWSPSPRGAGAPVAETPVAGVPGDVMSPSPRRTGEPVAFALVGVVVGLSLVGCSTSTSEPLLSFGPVILENQPLSWPKDFDRLESDGHIVLAKGRRYQLAGIAMRPVSDTHEPEGVRQASKLIGSEVEIVDVGDGVEAFYKKGKNYYCKDKFKLPHPLTIRHYEKQYERQSVNEMLIETGLARWDSTDRCDAATSGRLATMQRRYDERLRVLPTEARRDQHVYVSPVSWRDKYSWAAYRAAGVRMVRPCPGDLERIGLIQLSSVR